MTFAEAMQALQDGKTVRRKEWCKGNWWHRLVGVSWRLDIYSTDVEATDWEIVEEPKPKRTVKMRFYVWKGLASGMFCGEWFQDGKPEATGIPTDQTMNVTFEEPEG